MSGHITPEDARAYARAERPVTSDSMAHLIETDCLECHNALRDQFDAFLVECEQRGATGRIPTFLTTLSDLFAYRHLCPEHLESDLARLDDSPLRARALRHYRLCPLCCAEVDDILTSTDADDLPKRLRELKQQL